MSTSIEQWLTAARSALQQSADDVHSRESAQLDAQLLLGHVLQQNRTYLYTWGDKRLSAEQQQAADELLVLRQQGQPLAYLLGEREFWSLPFKVAPSTLIPRADTETLIEWALELELPAAGKALDLGTGTGAIALALASEYCRWQITGVDFHNDAVALAQSNGERLGFRHAQFLQSDWYSALVGQAFDLIVSNPPYIDGDDPHLSQGDVRFEPKSALVAEDAGMADLAHIISQAPEYLNDGGWLLLEHGFQQAEAVCELLTQHGFTQVENRKDLGGNPRISGGCWESNQ